MNAGAPRVSASLAYRGRRAAAGALARAGAWLVEPLETPARPAISLRPVVAVVGLASRCGTTTVARAIATGLAASDPAGAAAVAGSASGRTLAIGAGQSARLARAVGAGDGRTLRPAGRLCLVEGGDQARLADAVRHLAPLVLDVGHGEPPGAPLSLADHALLVASADIEPALATVVASSLARIGPPPLVVLNGAGEDEAEGWSGRAEITLVRSRVGARLALAGRDPRGTLGEGIAGLASICEAVRSDW